MDEHVLQNDSDLQLSPCTFDGNVNYVPHLAENTLYQHYIVKTEDHDNHSVPQWSGYQQMAPYYVEYLAGNGIADIQGETPYDDTRIGCSFIPDESLRNMGVHQVTHSRLQHEEVLVNKFISTQHEVCYKVIQKSSSLQCMKQVPDEGQDYAAQHHPNMSASTSAVLTKPSKTYSRQKATDTDRRRRTRIAAALDALEDSLPHSKEGNKTNIVDDCIDYIKYLQLHMKELSQNRLGGEPTSSHLTFLEGYGHYLVHENTASGPLQDMLGKLLEANPSAATKLLESRGLFMMPVAPN